MPTSETMSIECSALSTSRDFDRLLSNVLGGRSNNKLNKTFEVIRFVLHFVKVESSDRGLGLFGDSIQFPDLVGTKRKERYDGEGYATEAAADNVSNE